MRSKRGEAKGEARALLAALRVRGIPVPDAARERILAETDPERLERWVERAIVATSLDEVLDKPRRGSGDEILLPRAIKSSSPEARPCGMVGLTSGAASVALSVGRAPRSSLGCPQRPAS